MLEKFPLVRPLTAAALAATLVLGLEACSGGPEAQQPHTTQAPNAPPSPAETETYGPGDPLPSWLITPGDPGDRANDPNNSSDQQKIMEQFKTIAKLIAASSVCFTGKKPIHKHVQTRSPRLIKGNVGQVAQQDIYTNIPVNYDAVLTQQTREVVAAHTGTIGLVAGVRQIWEHPPKTRPMVSDTILFASTRPPIPDKVHTMSVGAMLYTHPKRSFVLDSPRLEHLQLEGAALAADDAYRIELIKRDDTVPDGMVIDTVLTLDLDSASATRKIVRSHHFAGSAREFDAKRSEGMTLNPVTVAEMQDYLDEAVDMYDYMLDGSDNCLGVEIPRPEKGSDSGEDEDKEKV